MCFNKIPLSKGSSTFCGQNCAPKGFSGTSVPKNTPLLPQEFYSVTYSSRCSIPNNNRITIVKK